MLTDGWPLNCNNAETDGERGRRIVHMVCSLILILWNRLHAPKLNY